MAGANRTIVYGRGNADVPWSSTLTRVRAGLTACLVLLASVLLPATPASADERADCLREGSVWVVVQPDRQTTWTGCAATFSTGLAALTSAGFRTDTEPFFQRINGLPAELDGQHYWSFWHATPNAKGGFSGFSYAQTGANTFRPEPGSVVAFSHAFLGASPSDAMPTVTLPGLRRPSVFGDQDGNGQADLLAVDEAGTLLLYPVRGQHLGQPFTAGQGWGSYTWVSAVPDIDGDALAELVGRRSDGSLWLLRGLGGGSYGPALQIGRGWNDMSMLTVMEDITGDALPELFARSRTGQLVRYSFSPDSLTGNDGFLTGAAVVGHGWQDIRLATSLGDCSGDAVPDLLAVTSSGALLRYSIADGGIASVHQVGRHWQSMTLLTSPGDLTRDGLRDLVALRSDGTLWVYPHRGDGSWGSVRQLSVGMTTVAALA